MRHFNMCSSALARVVSASYFLSSWFCTALGNDPPVMILTDQMGQHRPLDSVQVTYDLGLTWSGFPEGLRNEVQTPHELPVVADDGVVWLVSLDKIAQFDQRATSVMITLSTGDQVKGRVPGSCTLTGMERGQTKEYALSTIETARIDSVAMRLLMSRDNSARAECAWPIHYTNTATVALRDGRDLAVTSIAFLQRGSPVQQGATAIDGMYRWRIANAITVPCSPEFRQARVWTVAIGDLSRMAVVNAQGDSQGRCEVEVRTWDKVSWQGRIPAERATALGNKEYFWDTVSLIGVVSSGNVLLPLSIEGLYVDFSTTPSATYHGGHDQDLQLPAVEETVDGPAGTSSMHGHAATRDDKFPVDRTHGDLLQSDSNTASMLAWGLLLALVFGLVLAVLKRARS